MPFGSFIKLVKQMSNVFRTAKHRRRIVISAGLALVMGLISFTFIVIFEIFWKIDQQVSTNVENITWATGQAHLNSCACKET